MAKHRFHSIEFKRQPFAGYMLFAKLYRGERAGRTAEGNNA
jgi:hypothetical protein